MPTSTVRMPSRVAVMGPIVEPQGTRLFDTNSWLAIPAVSSGQQTRAGVSGTWSYAGPAEQGEGIVRQAMGVVGGFVEHDAPQKRETISVRSGRGLSVGCSLMAPIWTKPAIRSPGDRPSASSTRRSKAAHPVSQEAP